MAIYFSLLWRTVRLVGGRGLDEGLQLAEPGLYGGYGRVERHVDLPPPGIEDLRHQAAVRHAGAVPHTCRLAGQDPGLRMEVVDVLHDGD